MPEQQLGLKVGLGDVNRTCPSCGQNDEGQDPRHVILGVAVEQKQATLADGTVVAVNVPVDQAYHKDCHAAMGCELCADILEENDGSVKGKVGKIKAPVHLNDTDITDHFTMSANGILRRTEAGHKHMKAAKNG